MIHVEPLYSPDWTPEVINYVKQCIEKKKVKIMPYDKNHDTYNAIIHFKGCVNLNANLVQKKYALSTGPW